MRIAPGADVVQARDQAGDGGLAGARRADQGDQSGPGSAVKVTSRSTSWPGPVSSDAATASSEASDTSDAAG